MNEEFVGSGIVTDYYSRNVNDVSTYISSGGFLTIGNGIGCNWANDIISQFNDKTMKISELLNPNPEIEGLEMKKFVIQ